MKTSDPNMLVNDLISRCEILKQLINEPSQMRKKTQKNPDTNRENIKGWLQNLIRHYERFRSSEWKTKRERERERERADS